MNETLAEMADAVGELEGRVAEVIYETVRAQLRDDSGTASAHELERRLAKVRRSLQKAEVLLRGYAGD